MKSYTLKAVRAIHLYCSVPSKAYKGLRLIKKIPQDMANDFSEEIFDTWGRGERVEIADRAIHMIFHGYMDGIAALDSNTGKIVAIAAYDDMDKDDALKMLRLDYYRDKLEKLRERWKSGKITDEEYEGTRNALELPKKTEILMKNIIKNNGAVRLGYLAGVGRGGGSKLFGEMHAIAKAKKKPLYLDSLDDATDFYKKVHAAQLPDSKVFYLLP